MKADGTLTLEEIEAACKNIGVDLKCGHCAAIFFTGMGASGHDLGCKTARPRSSDLADAAAMRIALDAAKLTKHYSVCAALLFDRTADIWEYAHGDACPFRDPNNIPGGLHMDEAEEQLKCNCGAWPPREPACSCGVDVHNSKIDAALVPGAGAKFLAVVEEARKWSVSVSERIRAAVPGVGVFEGWAKLMEAVARLDGEVP